MRRVFKLPMLALGAVAFGAAAYGIWYLRSDPFQERVRGALVSYLQEATGMEVSVGHLKLDVLLGDFALREFSMKPRPGKEAAFEVEIQELHGSFRILSLYRLRMNLANLHLEQPRFRLLTRPGVSTWNPETFLRVLRRSFEFSARQVTARHGWVEINNRRVPFDLSLRDLSLGIRYVRLPEGYAIQLAYKDGRFVWAGRDIEYDLETQMHLGVDGVDIEAFELLRPESRFAGTGWLRDWKSPALLVHTNGSVAGGDLALFHDAMSDASGEVRVQANLSWDAGGFRAEGTFDAPAGGYRQAAVRELTGGFDIREGTVTLRDMRGRIGAGTLEANAVFQLGSRSEAPHTFEVSTKSLALRDAASIFRMEAIGFENKVDATAKLAWRKGVQDLEVQCSTVLHPVPAAELGAGSRHTGLHGTIDFAYDRGAWHIGRAELSSPRSEIRITGVGDWRSQIRARTDRLQESLDLVRAFSTALDSLLKRHPDIEAIQGLYQLDGEIMTGTVDRWSYSGSLDVSRGRWRTWDLERGSANLTWSAGSVALQSLRAQRGPEVVEGSLRIDFPIPEDGLPGLHFSGQVQRVSQETIRQLGLEVPAGLQGNLNGKGVLEHNAGRWTAEGQVAIDGGRYEEERFDRLEARVSLRDQILRFRDGRVSRGPTEVRAEGELRLDTEQLKVAARVSRYALTDLPALREEEVELQGWVDAGADVGGTIEHPSVRATVRMQDLRYKQWDLGVGNGVLELRDRAWQGELNVRSELGRFAARGRISSDADRRGEVRLEFRDWNLQKLLDEELPPSLRDLSTAMQGEVLLRGSFADPGSIAFEGTLDGARLKIQDHELQNSGQIRFSGANRRVRIEDAKLTGAGTQLTLSGEVALEERPSLDLRLRGDVNLDVVVPRESKASVSGSAALDVTVSGTLEDPRVIGQATVSNARLDYGDLPFYFSGLNGGLVFSRNSVRLENIRGNVASGSIELNGAMEIQNAEVRSTSLQIQVRRARLPYPRDFRSTVDADLNLRGTVDAPVLAGSVHVLRAEYLRDFSLLEQLVSRTPGPPAPQVTDPFVSNIRLNIAIHSGDGLTVDTELMRLRGGMRLTLRGTPAYPSLTGRVETTEGFIFFRGTRFEIIRAAADFVDRNRIIPTFDVRAEADVRSYRLLLDVSGALDSLRFNITSDPPMSTVDIVSLLATGKSREPGLEGSRRQAEITGISAASILSESITGVLGRRVQRLFGFESFRVDPFLAGAEHDPTARVTISERLSKDLTITFSRNLSTNEEQVVVMEYDVNRNFTIVATRDEDGDFGVDFRFRKRFR